MRVLVATTANAGHFGPLLPFARACVAAGHEVRVAAPESFAAAVEQAGLTHLAMGDAPEEELAAVFATLPQMSLEDANTVVMRDVFAGIDARAALPGLAAGVRDWRPDLVLRETAEFASYVVAEQERIPHAHVSIGTTGLEEFAYPLLDDALAQLGADRRTAGLRSSPTLSLVPECLDETAAADERRAVHRFRYQPPPQSGEERSRQPGESGEWSDPAAPLVYATFGTIAANVGLYPDLYRAVIGAVAEMPVRVLLTIGEAADPELLRPLPPNVHVEGFFPQQDVMPQASAVIGHGGFGTTMLALTAGVPMVTIPLFSVDQHLNAKAVARTGAGITLDGGPAASDHLAAALRDVLDQPTYRSSAQDVAAEIARLPPPSTSVGLLEDIAQT